MTDIMRFFSKKAQLRPISPDEIKAWLAKNKHVITGVGGSIAGVIGTVLAHKYLKNKAYSEANKHSVSNKSLADALSESFIAKHKLGDVTLVKSTDKSETPDIKIKSKNNKRQIQVMIPTGSTTYSNIDDPVVRLLALGRAKAALDNPKTQMAHKATESLPYRATSTVLRIGLLGKDKNAQKYTSLAMRSVSPQLRSALNTEAENYAMRHLKEEAPDELPRGENLARALRKTYMYEKLKPVTMFAASKAGFAAGRKLGGG